VTVESIFPPLFVARLRFRIQNNAGGASGGQPRFPFADNAAGVGLYALNRETSRPSISFSPGELSEGSVGRSDSRILGVGDFGIAGLRSGDGVVDPGGAPTGDSRAFGVGQLRQFLV
jgi:hypothetical protein